MRAKFKRDPASLKLRDPELWQEFTKVQESEWVRQTTIKWTAML